MYKRMKNYVGASTKKRFELLTPKELRVMKLTGQGYLTGQVAEKMGIAKSTVDSFRMRTVRKLKITRATYRRWAFRLVTDYI